MLAEVEGAQDGEALEGVGALLETGGATLEIGVPEITVDGWAAGLEAVAEVKTGAAEERADEEAGEEAAGALEALLDTAGGAPPQMQYAVSGVGPSRQHSGPPPQTDDSFQVLSELEAPRV